MAKTWQIDLAEKRVRPRAKLAKMLHVRRVALRNDCAELVSSKNVSRNGIYFHTHRSDYKAGMRLFATFPFIRENDPMNTCYVAEVVRVDALGEYLFGIAIKLISTI